LFEGEHHDDDNNWKKPRSRGDEARIAALEGLVGKLALENEFLKGASRHVSRRLRATIAEPDAAMGGIADQERA
jgi:hypothetical protein